MEQRIGALASDEPPRFIADAMLGRVARWLRTLGYDTAYDASIEDEDLVRRALLERRYILTRDRGLPEEWRVEPCFVLSAEGTEEQLTEVARALGLKRPARLFTRCRACNAELEPARPADVSQRVPPRVLERATDFRRCPECERVYWEGTHTERMRALLDRIFSRDK